MIDLADSLGLVYSLPALPISTHYLNTNSHTNSVIDLIFLGMNSFQVLHCIKPDLRLPSDHAPLLVDLPISPERRSSNAIAIRRVHFSLQSTWIFALLTSQIWAWLLAWTLFLRQSLEYLPMLGRLILGLSLLQLDPRSGGMMSAGVYLSFTDAQEPERTDAYFALLQRVPNNLSLTTELQKLHLLTSTLGTL